MQVELKIKEQLDLAWNEYFEDLNIESDSATGTLLSGELADQAALYGLLTKLIKLGLTLVSFESREISPVSAENDYHPE